MLRSRAWRKGSRGTRGKGRKSTRAVLKKNETGNITSLTTKRGWKRYLPHRWITALGVIGLVFVLILLLTKGEQPVATDVVRPVINPAASRHLPLFITPPGETDVLFVIMALVLFGAVLAAGVFFFWLHSLPERMVHNSTKLHFDIVAVLGLLSLFTHIHLFWVAALLLALVKVPSFSMPDFSDLLGRIARSLEKMSDAESRKAEASSPKPSRLPPERGK
jgi:hypothetical protein